MIDLLITNIGELATAHGNSVRKGANQDNILKINNAAVGIAGDKIAYVGSADEAPEAKETLDAGGKLVTAGLVDAHTHLVFGGWRQNEIPLKLNGATYVEILKSGGGILSTVRSTRAASKQELFEKAEKLTEKMIEHGTTSCEAKSGYGLNYEDELKQLEVVKMLQESGKMDIVSTFLGGHAVPDEFLSDRDGYVDLLCNEIIPKIAEKKLADYCDVFCENSAFTVSQSRRIMEAAKQNGFRLKIHADELESIGGAELAAEMGAASAEHLIHASDEGIAKMAEKGVIPVLLPATSFYLDKPFARAKKMIEDGNGIAVASDFNPGSSPNLNLQFPMLLAVQRYKLTPEQALTAATINAAAAIGFSEKVGTIEIGKQADIVIWDSPDLNFLFYTYGDNKAERVIKKGKIIV